MKRYKVDIYVRHLSIDELVEMQNGASEWDMNILEALALLLFPCSKDWGHLMDKWGEGRMDEDGIDMLNEVLECKGHPTLETVGDDGENPAPADDGCGCGG